MMSKRGSHPILPVLFVLNLSAGATAQHPEWVRKYSVPTSAADSAGPVATDSAGNVFAALSNGYGWTTCKYDPAGELIWFSTTNARSGFAEPAVGLAVDFTGRSFAAANDYVDGRSRPLIICVSPGGEPLWQVEIAGPSGTSAYASGLALAPDQQGIIVVGASLPLSSAGAIGEAWVRRYSRAGALEWETPLEGTRSWLANDQLALDANGNVYTAGQLSSDNTYHFDLWGLWKLNPAGELDWVATVSDGALDYAHAVQLASNDVGDVVVTGTARGADGRDHLRAWGVNAAGVTAFEQWVEDGSETQPAGVVADDDGHFLILGVLNGNCLMTRIGAGGVRDWLWTSEPSGWAGAPLGAVGVNGGATIAARRWDSFAPLGGSRYFAVIEQVSSQGQSFSHYEILGAWDSYPQATPLVRAGDGRLALNMTTRPREGQSDSLTTVIRPDGQAIWSHPFDGTVTSQMPTGAAQRIGGGVIVASTGGGPNASLDSVLLAYDAQGALDWSASFGDPASSESLTPLAGSPGGGAVAAGTTRTATSSQTYILRYDNHGAEIARTPLAAGLRKYDTPFLGPAPRADGGFDLLVTETPGDDPQFSIASFSASGLEQSRVALADIPFGTTWYRVRRNLNNETLLGGIALATSGHPQRDILLAKFSPEGALNWTATHVGLPMGSYFGDALPLPDGGALLAGTVSLDSRNYRMVVVRYDANGQQTWVREFDDDGRANTGAISLLIGPDGDVFVLGGHSPRGMSEVGSLVCRLDALTGGVRWAAEFDNPRIDENAVSMEFTSAGNLAVTIVSRRIDSNAHHTIVLEYSPEGARIGSARYEGDLVGANYTKFTSTDASGLHYVVMASTEPASAELRGSSTAVFTYRRDPLLRLGDANCDGRVDNFDIDAFVLGMTDIDAWHAAYSACPASNLDMNGTGTADLFDIDPFVLLITNGRVD